MTVRNFPFVCQERHSDSTRINYERKRKKNNRQLIIMGIVARSWLSRTRAHCHDKTFSNQIFKILYFEVRPQSRVARSMRKKGISRLFDSLRNATFTSIAR